MQVSPSFGNTYKPTKKDYVRAATSGAIVTAGFSTLSTGISFVTRNAEMKQLVHDIGGKSKYLKNFATGLAILSAMGAGFSVLFTAIASKIHSKKEPKAVN